MSSVIGPIIPPSIPMVLYALVSDASIGFLFLGGVIPGLLMALSQMIIIAATARRKNFPVEKPVPLRKLPGITWHAFPTLMMPVVLLGGIYSGIMTPTEAAAVAAAYALIISAGLYRSVSWRDFYRSIAISARTTAFDRHADRRCARIQLRRDGRKHPREREGAADRIGICRRSGS